MRTLRKNKSQLKYSLQSAIIPAFETDENGNIKFASYIDDDGNEFFFEDENGNKVPEFLTSGGIEVLYGEPVSFKASVGMSGGESQSLVYGLSTESYEAEIITSSGYVPLTEGSLIWFKSEPEYISNEPIHIIVNDEEISGMFAKRTSADFFVKKIITTKNFDRYILGAVNK